MKSKLLLSVFILTIGCTATQKNEPEQTSWAGKMQSTAQSFQELLPFIYNTRKFNNPKNKTKILKKIDAFKSSSHKINPKTAKLIMGEDPYVIQSLNHLNELNTRAKRAFQKDDNKTAQILLKSTTTTCFKCHTRQNLGPQKLSWKNFDIDSIQTTALEKSHILVSMRQYKKAKEHLNKYLNDSEIDQNFDIVYENSLHYYLMITLRGQNTFKETRSFIERKILVTKLPTSLHYTLKHWLKDLKSWEKKGASLKPTLSAARMVLKRKKNKYIERNLIHNLIASSLLHNYLMTGPTGLNQAKAYSLLGEVYDELVLEGFWDLPEIYYEMCINKAPKTTTSQKCFESLKDNITVGYSGSRGTVVPKLEYERLEKLRKKAEVQ